MSDQRTILRERLDQNYKDYMVQLHRMTADELILFASDITAAKQLHEELPDVCDEDDIAFLLHFDNPLKLLTGYWEAEITGYDHSDEMSHMLWEVRDRELIPAEDIIPPSVIPDQAKAQTTSPCSKRGQER